MKAYYFGCWGDKGHYLWGLGQHRIAGRLHREFIPSSIADRIDSLFCPKGDGQQLGKAVLHHLDGWTVLAFWDRSVDSRPGSNSNFVVEGTHDFDAMCAVAAKQFPEVWKRITSAFPVEPQYRIWWPVQEQVG